MDSIHYTWLLAIVIALPVAYLLWRSLGPSTAARHFHEQPENELPESEPCWDEPPSTDDPYEPIGWYGVVEAKQLFRRLEQAGVDFHVEAPHLDPAGGNAMAAAHGSYGNNAEVMLYVHHHDLETFDAIQRAMHQDETNSDGSSFLQAFRSFGIHDGLDETREEAERQSFRE